MRPITDTYYACGQIVPEQLAALKADGFDTVICNRPDAEVDGNPGSEAIRAEAERLGLTFVYNPLTPGALTAEHVAAQRGAIAGAGGKVLGFCKSGLRSAMLWGLANKDRMAADDIIAAAAQAGYDISPIRPALG